MTTKDLLSALINASEKAANIARICREDENLFNLLIEGETNFFSGDFFLTWFFIF